MEDWSSIYRVPISILVVFIVVYLIRIGKPVVEQDRIQVRAGIGIKIVPILSTLFFAALNYWVWFHPNETVTLFVYIAFALFGIASVLSAYYAMAARLEWSAEGVKRIWPPFQEKFLAWHDMKDAGWNPIEGFWVSNGKDTRVRWCDSFCGAVQLFKVVRIQVEENTKGN